MTFRQTWCGALILAVGLTVALSALAQPPFSATAKRRPGTEATSDIELVERLLATRREYQQALEKLWAHYQTTGDVEKARWAEEELRQYHRVAKPAYRLELDVPPPTLQATQNIPEANELYRRAMTFKDKGWTWTNEYVDNQHRAEILLQQLLTQHPQSDKISDAAYQLGDVYESKAFKQNRRAAQYFERCFQWNPNTQLDARLRAARLYDRSLMERGRAMELYREVSQRETDPKRLQEATRRLSELSGAR